MFQRNPTVYDETCRSWQNARDSRTDAFTLFHLPFAERGARGHAGPVQLPQHGINWAGFCERGNELAGLIAAGKAIYLGLHHL